MRNIDTSGFSAMMQVENKDLKQITFKDNSSLNTVKQYLASKITLNIAPDITDGELVGHVVNELSAIMKDSESLDYLGELERIAANLSSTISNSYHTIQKTIYDLVSYLKDQIDTEMDVELRHMGIDPGTGSSSIPVNFTQINWENMKTMAQVEAIVTKVKELCNIVSSDVNKVSMTYAVRKINRPGFVDLALAKERINELAEQCAKVSKKFNLEDYVFYLNILTSKSHYNGFTQILNRNANLETINVTVNELYSAYYDLTYFTDIIKQIPMDNLSADTQNTIYDNNEKLIEVGFILAYCLLVCKDKIFKDTLIINKTTLNSDELNKFTKDGKGNISDIAKYIYVYYSSRDIPLMGIPTEIVDKSKELVAEKLKEVEDKRTLRLKVGKNRATIKSFEKVLNKYLMEIDPSMLPGKVSKEDFYQVSYPAIRNAEHGLGSKYENLEDALYNFVINVHYKGTIIETLYKYLSDEYVKMESVDAGSLRFADTAVTGFLVSEYLVNRFCCVK